MKKNPKFAFFGTPKGAVYVLDSLKLAGFVPELIVTLPDSEKGRKKILTEQDVALWAKANNIECFKPKKLSELNLPDDLDFSLVASYGKIIPKKIIDRPKNGTFNIHPSLLPKYRGPTPIQTAILNDTETGVTVIKLDELEDHGPILVRSESISIEGKNYPILERELFELGTKLFLEHVDTILDGTEIQTEQNHASATFTKKFEVNDAKIETKLILEGGSHEEILKAEKKVRALNPEPGTWTIFKTKDKELRVKILSARIENGKLTPEKVIPAGKKEMSWTDFKLGNKF